MQFTRIEDPYEDAPRTTVRSEDPWRVEKTVTVDGCRLATVFDDDGTVETITHVDFRRDERDDESGSGERVWDT